MYNFLQDLFTKEPSLKTIQQELYSTLRLSFYVSHTIEKQEVIWYGEFRL